MGVKRRAAALTLGVITLIGLAVVWEFGSMMVAPTPSVVAVATPPARDMVLKASDAMAVATTYWPGRSANAPAVLLFHGNGASRAQMATQAAWLNSLGYAAMTADFRGHGGSASANHSFGLFESRDAEAAFAWLKRKQQGAPVAVIGLSLGGAAALLGDKGPLPAQAMVLLAVYPDIRAATYNRIVTFLPGMLAGVGEPMLTYQSMLRFGVWPSRMAPLPAVRRYHGPVLFIGGGADGFTPPGEVRAMYDAAPGPKDIWIVEGFTHADVSGMDTEESRAKIGAFLKRTIGLPTSLPVPEEDGI